MMRRAMMAVTAGLVAAAPAAAQDFTGDWNGTLTAGGGQLRLVLHVTESDDGMLSATMDSPDQAAFGIPASGVSTSGDTLVVDFANITGQYRGTLDAEAGTLTGTWTQGGQTFPLNLSSAPVEEARRPQNPEPPFPYEAEDVRFPGGADGVELAGTLTRPADGAPHAAAVLVSGSGPQNRDEEVFGHRPFGFSRIT